MTTRSENEKTVIEAFKNGPTHAKKLNYTIKDTRSLFNSILEINGHLFVQYLISKGITEDNYTQQKVMARAYSDMILSMLQDFIEKSEEGLLDE